MIFCTLLTVVVPGARAEEPSGLTVQTDVDSALVIVDGTLAGKSPVTVGNLEPGPHTIRVVHPDLENWFSPVIVDSIDLRPGETRDFQYSFTRTLFVRSDPSGAEVSIDQRVAGTTPLFLPSAGIDSLLEVRKRGYNPVSVSPAFAERGVIDVKLDPLTDQTDIDLNGVVPEHSSTLPIVLSGASSILAGGFSAYFKVKADEVHREYLITGDPSKLAETRKLDNVAGIALGASQIYLALFSYLMITR